MSIAMDVLKIVQEHLPKDHPVRVTKITLKVGKLTAVIADTFKFGMEIITKGTEAEGAEIVIDNVPLVVKCENCGEQSELSEPFFVCPKCESTRLSVLSGRDLYIESIEVEDNNSEETDNGNQSC